MSEHEFKVNDIVRHGRGATALMRIESFAAHNRAYGTHMMGGAYGAAYEDLRECTPEEIVAFKEKQFENLKNIHMGINSVTCFEREKLCLWAEKTFPTATETTVLNHMQSEMDELYDAVTKEQKGEEAADIMMLLLHFCHKNKISLSYEVKRKHLINIDRKWETEENEHGFFSHID